MSVAVKLAAFGAILAISFAAALGVGAIVGPIDVGGGRAPAHSNVAHGD